MTNSDAAGRLSRRDFLYRSAATGVAIGGVGALTSACEGSGSGERGGERSKTLILDMQSGRVQSPQLWNPFVPGFTGNAGFHQAVQEPLFMLNYETSEIEPWLGESFTPNDGLDVWTLKLRNGIKWSDGEDFDADDVVFTVMMLAKGPAELANAASMRQWVKSARKVDPTTVEFTLTSPNPRFQLDYFSVKTWGSIPIVPEHIWSGKDPVKFENYDPKKGWPVFTGPYKLESGSPTKFVYTRRDDWWGAKANFKPLPKPERLEFVVSETEDVRVAKASDHQLDSVGDMTAGAFQSLQSRNPEMISWLPKKPWAWSDPCTRLLSLNNAIEPWNDREMRWAVNYAIDRDEVVRIAYEGTTKPADFFFPPYPALKNYVKMIEDAGIFEEFPILKHDVAKAKQIIESKGYTKSGDYYQKDGKQLRLQIDAPTEYIEIWRYADVIGEQLQRIGINATVRKLASSIWGANIGNGKFEAASDWSACGSVNEPWYSMHLYTDDAVVPVGKTASSNSVRWKNAEYTKHVNAMANLPLGDKAIDKPFVAAARLFLQDLPFIPITYSRKLYAFDTHYWTGWATSENNYLEPTLDWENAHKIIHNLRPVK
ncbi:MAG TPA: ABC transporter substrate-binding protein [Mycobacteriales bacterium]|nr:ABC transporter substrate-binding protein [Mycobacteriales bacterium]